MPHRNYHTGWIHWEVSGGSATGSRWRSDWRLFWQPEDIPQKKSNSPQQPSPPAATGSGRPKVWTGAAWVQKPLKVWTGAAWVEKPVKVWDGTQWKTLT